MKTKILSVFLAVMMIFSSLTFTALADGEALAANTEYFESFEGYDEGSNGGWTSKENGKAEIKNLDGNNVLLITPASSVSGAYIDLADSDKLGNTIKENNFTVDFDFKFNEKNIKTNNNTPENLFSLSGLEAVGLKEAYAVFQAPASLDGSKDYNSNVAWTGNSGLGDSYKTAVTPSTTTGNTLYMHRWNHARMVCRTVTYNDNDEEKQADYAQIYINGKLVATLPQRNNAATLTKLAIGIDPKNVDGVGIYIDNVKAVVGEKGAKTDTTCDYEKYVLGPIGFDKSETTTAPSDSMAAIGNANIESEKVYINTGKTVNIYDGVYGKKTSDKYVYKPASSGDYQTKNAIETLKDGESFEISFDYLPSSKEMYFCQRVQIGSNSASFPRLLTLNDKYVKINDIMYYYNTSSAGLNNDEWYRITYVVTGGNGIGTYNTASVYVNGIPVAENIELTNYASGITGNTGEYMQWQKSGRTDIYGEGKFDNIQIKEYRGGARFKAPIISKAANEGFGAQYVPSDMTVADAKTYFALGEYLKYTVTDQNGNAAADSDSASGKYIRAAGSDGRYVYVKFIANETDIVNFDSADGISGTNLEVSGKDAFDYGKGADNKAALLKSQDGKTVGKYSKSAKANNAQTVEFYMFADNTFNLKIAGRPTYNGTDYYGGWVLLSIGGGNIGIADNKGTEKLNSPNIKNISKYKNGEWVKIGLTVYPGSDKYTVRVNNEEFSGSFAQRIKANGYFEAQIGTSANVIIDDYKIYNGRMSFNKGTKAVLDTSRLAKGILLDENKISVGKTITDCFEPNIANAKKVFTNSDGARAAAPVSGGKVIFENDGLYTSYDINSRKNAITQIDTDTDGKLKFVIDKTTDKNLSAINAVYCGDELVKADINDVNFGSDEAVYLYIDKPTDAQNNFKIFLWEISTATPFAAPVEYYVNK